MLICPIICRPEANDLELLMDAILKHWKTSIEIDLEAIRLDEGNINQAQNEGGYMYYY